MGNKYDRTDKRSAIFWLCLQKCLNDLEHIGPRQNIARGTPSHASDDLCQR